MLKIDDFRIAAKIGLIVALLSLVAFGAVSFTALRMKAIGDAYSDLITRVDASAIKAVRAGSYAEAYISAIYQLAAETSDEGSTRLLAQIDEDRGRYETLMRQVQVDLPEKSAIIAPVIEQLQKTSSACGPVVRFAASTTAADDPLKSLKAAARLKAECDPSARQALQAGSAMVDDLVAFAAASSAALSAQRHATILTVLVSVGAGLLAALAAALWIGSAGLAQPIGQLKSVMEAFARNDLASAVPGLGRRDELGEMARAVEIFKTGALDIERLRAAQQRQMQQAAADRKQALADLADQFEARVMDVVQRVSASAGDLHGTAQSMSQAASNATNETEAVAATVTHAAENVQSVASAAEELSASIQEISRQVADSTRISLAASDETARANGMVQGLSAAANRIGEVVRLINDIAAQTNLLALNATIEAARAGDAGKGFAVVAGEVKNLANQTGRATEEIAQQIASVQEETRRTVEAMKGIGAIIDQVRAIGGSIDFAVEAQGAATAEIARNVQEAALGNQAVAQRIGGVSASATSTSTAAGQLLSSAGLLAGDSEKLRREVLRFLAEIRSG